MSESLILRHCSPTLAGLKTGSLFCCTYQNRQEMQQAVRFWNGRLQHKGLRVLPLRYRKNKALLYFYRPGKLSIDLKNQTAIRLLFERGYSLESPEKSISHLRKRLTEQPDFPHEIGLFLGYPPEDVCGFIENGAANCKCVGCWKVYGNVEDAQKKFALYKKCTAAYCRQYAKGKTVERLAVRTIS